MNDPAIAEVQHLIILQSVVQKNCPKTPTDPVDGGADRFTQVGWCALSRACAGPSKMDILLANDLTRIAYYTRFVLLQRPSQQVGKGFPCPGPRLHRPFSLLLPGLLLFGFICDGSEEGDLR
ncbi:hypothetical protein M406DRAFT_357358 [Cryphonectria parasitica EP155]|uniref:Uncharacterized protein n=1 Tax=Cryphonectria parasitica (strain ATCC 38755 / EP155) TaxID=660469 RepID=A0A9P4XVR0_CRYP1|nr:uncharacterized protein M406DRAFT_357358 [Cryphonectria parasitica EP155]KAF3762174.1 hypothetical protein M406DRAFT_357358 [Cryphonectria parasitica EP155]